ncbi:MAG: Eco57I restriction-modification methylase domain-containing protein [Lachnospiraceae bacterium]|nr:Eco57I restriction-modification methylase domain-containing protein [Lachnospiraceae bacterium]
MERIKMFDWTTEYGAEGFDVIVGNPPYIRVQNMVHYSPDEYAFYKSDYSGYQTAGAELLDKYYLFIERAWSLLKDGGVIGYIIPHKFMNITSGKALRGYLTERNAVRKVLHFGTHQVFQNRSTYTCILILSKNEKQTFDISFVKNWNQFLFEHRAPFQTYDIRQLGENPWTFIPYDIQERFQTLDSVCSPLETMAHIFVGVQTSADKIYIIYPEKEDDMYVYFRDKSGADRKIEKGILKESIYDTALRKYERIMANSYIIFPYVNAEGSPKLIKIDTMRETFPNAYEYLSAFREELDRRNMPNRTEDTWYAYGRGQSLRRFIGKEHLIWPVLSLGSNYVYDNGQIIFTGGGNGPFYGIEMKEQTWESIFYVQAILNHWLMETVVKKSASTFRGDYYSHGKQFIAKLPIMRIDFNEPQQVKLHDEIVKKVHQIEQLAANTNHAENSSVRNTLQRAKDAATRELDGMIDELYGVSGMRSGDEDESD